MNLIRIYSEARLWKYYFAIWFVNTLVDRWNERIKKGKCNVQAMSSSGLMSVVKVILSQHRHKVNDPSAFEYAYFVARLSRVE